MVNYFKQPYPCLTRASQKLISSLVISVFVFVFLSIFQPFGIHDIPGDWKYLVLSGYGFITFFAMNLNNFLVPLLFPPLFKEKDWTLAREIFWVMWHIFIIGLGNLAYTSWLGFADLNWKDLAAFQLITMLVGIWPVVGFILLNQMRLMRINLNEAIKMTEMLLQQKSTYHYKKGGLYLPSENEQERGLDLEAEQLLLIKSAENYNEIFYVKGEEVKKAILRGSLKMMQESLREYDQFYRCHRSFIVNLEKVHIISGNSQGLKLHLDKCPDPVPVARSQAKEIKELLQQHDLVEA